MPKTKRDIKKIDLLIKTQDVKERTTLKSAYGSFYSHIGFYASPPFLIKIDKEKYVIDATKVILTIERMVNNKTVEDLEKNWEWHKDYLRIKLCDKNNTFLIIERLEKGDIQFEFWKVGQYKISISLTDN